MMPENDEDVEHPEANGRNDKEIDGGNACAYRKPHPDAGRWQRII
jgi:hypothetical protein